MRRLLDSARRDSHHGPPFSIYSRLSLLLASIGLGTLVSSDVLAEELPFQVEYHIQLPTAPGDPYSFLFEHVPGYHAGLLFSDQSTPPNNASANTDFEDELDLHAATLIPLSSETNGSGYVGLNGVVPNTVTKDELEALSIEVRLVLFDPVTEECLISDPLPLTAPPEAPAIGSLPTQGLTSSAAQTNTNSEESKTYASTVGDPQTPASPIAGTIGVAINELGTGTFGMLFMRPIARTFLTTNIHDQPTPVQGSGH